MCNAKRVYAMDYKVNWDSGGVFAVPDAAAEALRLASGKALKVLIYMLKYRRLPDDPDEIGVTAEDIDEALSYWSSVGVIYRSGNAPQAKVSLRRMSLSGCWLQSQKLLFLRLQYRLPLCLLRPKKRSSDRENHCFPLR